MFRQVGSARAKLIIVGVIAAGFILLCVINYRWKTVPSTDRESIEVIAGNRAALSSTPSAQIRQSKPPVGTQPTITKAEVEQQARVANTVSHLEAELRTAELRRTKFLWEQDVGGFSTTTLALSHPSTEDIAEMSRLMSELIKDSLPEDRQRTREALQKKYDTFTNFPVAFQVIYLRVQTDGGTGRYVRVSESWTNDPNTVVPRGDGSLLYEGPKGRITAIDIESKDTSHRFYHMLTFLEHSDSGR